MGMPSQLDTSARAKVERAASGELDGHPPAKPGAAAQMASPRVPIGFVGCARCQKSFPDVCVSTWAPAAFSKASQEPAVPAASAAPASPSRHGAGAKRPPPAAAGEQEAAVRAASSLAPLSTNGPGSGEAYASAGSSPSPSSDGGASAAAGRVGGARLEPRGAADAPVRGAERAEVAAEGAQPQPSPPPRAPFRCPPCCITEETYAAVESLSADEREARALSLQHMQPLLVKLRQHPSAKPFLHPVDPVRLRVPDYYSRVKAPMDLDLVKLRLTKGFYTSAEALSEDVARVWRNACDFNPAGSIVHRFALECASFWEEHLGQTLTAHAAGLLAGGQQSRKRKQPQPKREAAEGAEGAGGADGAHAGAQRPRAPKAAKRAHAGAPAAGDEEGAAPPSLSAEQRAAGGGGGGARVLAKGWALELVPEGAVDPLAEAARTPLPGQARVRKAKVRWEPEEITAGAGGRDGGGGGGGALPMPPGVRKQRRSSGGTRCGLQEGAHEHSSAQQWESDGGAFATPGASGAGLLAADAAGSLRADGGSSDAPLIVTAPTTLYDVAAALPEIDVGDDLEGVAGDLDDLLDFLPLPFGAASPPAPSAPSAAEPLGAGAAKGAEPERLAEGCAVERLLAPLEPDSQDALPLESLLAIDV